MGEAEPAVETRSRAPRANAIPERFLGTLRRELLDPLLIINQRHAAIVLQQYAHHHNDHRPGRALGQAAPRGPLPHRTTTEINNVRHHDRLGVWVPRTLTRRLTSAIAVSGATLHSPS